MDCLGESLAVFFVGFHLWDEAIKNAAVAVVFKIVVQSFLMHQAWTRLHESHLFSEGIVQKILHFCKLDIEKFFLFYYVVTRNRTLNQTSQL